MKNNKKRILSLILVLVLTFSLGMPIPVYASSKDVTKKYKKQVSKVLKNFDEYLAYGCLKGKKLKYDDYAKTTMVYLTDLWNYYGQDVGYNKSKVIKKLKLYFGTNTIKIKKLKDGSVKNVSDLIQNRDGTIAYLGGYFAEGEPVGYVKKIVQTSSKKLTVTYQIKHVNTETNKSRNMGTYAIYLKKVNNKNGFVITNIKRTKVNYLKYY
jgi:hypothetical protein